MCIRDRVGAAFPLEDERSIRGYNIADGASVTLQIRSALKVYVKTPDCMTHVLELNSYDSVNSVKDMIM